MNRLFYPKLALTNLKNNKKSYIPYIITSICTILMFYNMYALSVNPALDSMKGGFELKLVLSLGNIVIGIFAVIFLIYTNQFLIKRRKKEIGLYNILGMDKKHISIVMFFEALYVGVLSTLLGLGLGIIFSKLIYLALAKLLKFNVRFGFFVTTKGMLITVILFAGIFLLTYINNLRQIHLAKPVELLKGSNIGEAEPKIKWLLLILGILSLGGGYYISITTTNPIAALTLFFVAVVLVIIGTYCLFTTGSIALLKMLRKNKGYYYKTEHFISVSSMIHRMKQNAVGLANICILSTMVLVMLSSTISLYVGMDDVIKGRYPRNMQIKASGDNEEAHDAIRGYIEAIIEEEDVNVSNVSYYNYITFLGDIRENKIIGDRATLDKSIMLDSYLNLLFITQKDYNRILNTSEELQSDQIMIITERDRIEDSLDIFGKKYTIVKEGNKQINSSLDYIYNHNNTLIIVKDVDVIKEVMSGYHNVNSEVTDLPNTLSFSSYYGFDVDDSNKVEVNLYKMLSNEESKTAGVEYIESAAESEESFLAIYGGLFFLGVFLGLLFMMATILIMYYKQISEGHDDRERFQIMLKVGLNKEEVKKTIGSQVLTVFFIPLVVAMIHIAFAFPVISRLLSVLGLTNVTLFAICTIITALVFAVGYGIVYMLTAREYYKIVM